MYRELNACDDIFYTEYEAIEKSTMRVTDLFSDLEHINRCLEMALTLCKQDTENCEYRFDSGEKINVLKCHFEIIEVKDV